MPNIDFAPVKRAVFVYNGHVRQAPSDPDTATTLNGFRVATSNVQVGTTSFEGDRNISGDQFLINGSPIPEPGSKATSNFFVSAADGASRPKVPNNLSVDAKRQITDRIKAGADSTTLAFKTIDDSYLATGFSLSAPVPSMQISKGVQGGPFKPGDPVTFEITVSSIGADKMTDVKVEDPGACTTGGSGSAPAACGSRSHWPSSRSRRRSRRAVGHLRCVMIVAVSAVMRDRLRRVDAVLSDALARNGLYVQVRTRSARRALRRTLPASSRSGWSTNS